MTSRLFSQSISLLILFSSVTIAQTSDTTPPTLVEFDFTPTAIDVSTGAVDVEITARVTDDLSGVWSLVPVEVTFYSPSFGQGQRFVANLISGDELDGQYSTTATFPPGIEQGLWTVRVAVFDEVRNAAVYDVSSLTSLGFPANLEVTSLEDITPPTIISSSVTPTVVDVSGGDVLVSATLELMDSGSGVDPNNSSLLYFSNAATTQGQFPTGSWTLDSGDEFNGVWSNTFTLRQHSASGSWDFNVGILRDNVGNETYPGPLPGPLVLSDPEDTEPPVLIDFYFTPSVINTSAGDADVVVVLELTDNLSGVGFNHFDISSRGDFSHYIQFTSPSSIQRRRTSGFRTDLTSGTPLGGTWEVNLTFPQFSEDGSWRAELLQISDQVHNMFSLSSSELEELGFEVELVVVRPSLESDGTSDSLGGTVNDDSFQNASITFPPGALDQVTDVAIDVFADPLAIPTPEGYQGIGTLFVNYSLVPEPDYPFPSPGVSITLPLINPLPEGAFVPLFFVNDDTGVLVPMLNTSGMQVIGSVDAGGMSATFNGISHFSIVVGLVPEVIPVTIDIKPGSQINSTNTTSRGTIPVALLSTPILDVLTQVDVNTLNFGATGTEDSLRRCNLNGEDVNGDGLLDLVCHFETQLTGFGQGTSFGYLTGKTLSGQSLEGFDSLRTTGR